MTSPRVDAAAFVHHSAVLIGDVAIDAQASVWPHASLRGDLGPIRVGRATSVQDGCVLHVDPGGACTLADHVTVGHRAVVHGATVGPDTIIGMGAVVLEGAEIGAGCIIAAGAVVKEKARIADASLVAGVPARVVRTDDTLRDRAHANAMRYAELVPRYLAGAFPDHRP